MSARLAKVTTVMTNQLKSSMKPHWYSSITPGKKAIYTVVVRNTPTASFQLHL